jgi:hypothetical protein
MNDERPKVSGVAPFRHSSFVLRHSFVIRHLVFVINHPLRAFNRFEQLIEFFA